MTNREIQTQLGRVWLGEIPERYSYEAGEVLEKSLPTQANASAQPRTIGVRIVRQGGVALYAVLGASYIPDASGELNIQVVLPKEMIWNEYAMSAGLIRRHADAILGEAVRQASRTKHLGSGTLRFDRATEHQIDSAPIIFYYCVRVIMALLDPAKSDVSDDEIEIIIGQAIWPDKSRDELKAMIAGRKAMWTRPSKAES